ncbi:Uncharacterised protein [Mycobacteroides abscessus subsp. abscessus]|nr:Uncharacterised protein [Mycobacteroides abscessus subsp. abscessus]
MCRLRDHSDDAVSWREACYRGSDCDNSSGDVPSQYGWEVQLDGQEPRTGLQIDRVDGSGCNGNSDVSGAGCRLVNLGESENAWVAGGFDCDGFHAIPFMRPCVGE